MGEDRERLQTPDEFNFVILYTVFIERPTLQRELVKFLVELVADIGRIPRLLRVASGICIRQEIC